MSYTRFALAAAFISSIPSRSLAAPVGINELTKRIIYQGRGTWVDVIPSGYCGDAIEDDDSAAAISSELFDSLSTTDNCGQWIYITNTANDDSALAQTRNGCAGCAKGDIDMSQPLYQQLGGLDTSELEIEWSVVPAGYSPQDS